MLKIGIESIGYFSKEQTIEESLEKIKQHGYDCIDYQEICLKSNPVYDLDEKDFKNYFEKLKKQADKVDISFSQMHALWPTDDRTEESRDSQFNYFVKEIEAANILSCPYLVVHHLLPNLWEKENSPEESWNLNFDFFTKLIPYAEKNNVVICYENLPSSMELSKINVIKKFIDTINSTYLKVCLDTGHANIVENDVAESILLLKDSLKCLHIHDNNKHADEHKIPYFGTIDWTKVIQALKKINYKGCLSLETHIPLNMPEPTKEIMQKSLALIIKNMAKQF